MFSTVSKREIPTLVIEQPLWQTHTDILRWRAVHQPELLAYRFLSDGETEDARLTNRELDRLARRIAGYLQQIGGQGERVLLLYPQGLEYVTAFFACLYAGAVAVPAYPPSSQRSFHRILAIAGDARAKVVLTTTQILTKLRRSPELLASLQEVQWITTDTLADEVEHHWSNPGMRADDLAFLQYISGSTGTPKGVMVSYGNLIHNNQAVRASVQHAEGTPFVSWLPLFHDMGLICNMLQAMYQGVPCILMAPSVFIQKPFRWLQAVSRYKAHTSGGPNFAYDLCVQKISPEQRATLDLSHWQVAFCGAEPIHAQTLRHFTQTFAECGFREQSFWPCYGLAESTVFVSGDAKQQQPLIIPVQKQALEHYQILAAAEHTENLALVGCGPTWEGQRAVIVDPEARTLCPAGHIGEIWLAGPSVAQGYWQRPEETQETF